MQGEDAEVHARAHLRRQRRVERPARGGRAARHEERGHQQDRRRRQQPEAPVVHARERHVGRADHHRHLPVREADERRHDRAEHHDEPVHGRELVEELGAATNCRPGWNSSARMLERHDAADEEHGQAEPQVHRADVLVVRRGDPAHDAPGMDARERRVVMRRAGYRCHLCLLIESLSGSAARSISARRPSRARFTSAAAPCRRSCCPTVALVGDDRRDLDVRELLPRGHGSALLAIQHELDVLRHRTGGDLGARQRRERAAAHPCRSPGDRRRSWPIYLLALGLQLGQGVGLVGVGPARPPTALLPLLATHCLYLLLQHHSTTIGMKP